MSSKIKRWIATMLSLVLLIGAIQLPVFAADAEQEQYIQTEEPVQDQMEQEQLPASEEPLEQSASEEELVGECADPVCYDSDERPYAPAKRETHPDLTAFREYCIEQMYSCPETVSISHLQIKRENKGTSDWISMQIYDEMPELFHVDAVELFYNENTHYYTRIKLKYKSFADTEEKYSTCYGKMVAGADALLNGIEGNNSLSNVQKALLLHDRLALKTAYDYETYSAGLEIDSNHCAYGPLGLGIAVCQGYAEAYMYLLQRVGIESDYCRSKELNHGWNIVYINNVAYHVDVTWDDPTWDMLGQVRHNNFLLSSDAMESNGHVENGIVDYNTTPNDTRYDNYYWKESDAAFQYINGKFYYINSVEEKLYVIDGANHRALFSVEGNWNYYNRCYARLATISDKLLYNTPTAIKEYDPATNTTKTVYTPYLSGSNKIFGFKYEKGTIICDISTTPNYTGPVQQVSYSYAPYCLHTDLYLESETKPTCTKAGEKVYTCMDCYELITETVAALGHKYGTYTSNNNATCTQNGTKTAKCTRCGKSNTITDTGSKKEHSWDEGVYTSGTATQDGYTTYTCTVCGEEKVVVIQTPPEITSQPKSVTAASKTTVQFSVSTKGVVRSYQWQYCKLYKWFDTSMTGCKTATLSVGATGSRNGYKYRCMITFKNGQVLYSDPAVLTVNTVINITSHPKNQTITLGNKAQFTAAASGETIKYQWQYQRPNSDSWYDTNMEGATKATVQIETTAARNGYKYRCKITDIAGKVVYTNSATLTALSITTQPKAVSADENATATFTIATSSFIGVIYQWQYSADGNSWKNAELVGFNTGTLMVPATADQNGYLFRCVLTDSRGNNLTSNSAKLTVNIAPVIKNPAKITSQPKSATALEGGKAVFKVTATGAVSYRWKFTKNGTTWSSTTLTGYNTATLTVGANADRNGYIYRCEVTGEDGVKVLSNTAKLTVATISTQPKSTYSFIGGSAKFSVEPSSTSGIKYAWEYRQTATSSWATTTMTGYNTKTLTVAVTSGREGYAYRCKLTDSFGNTLTSGNGVLHTVELTQQPVNKVAVLGGNATFSTAVSAPGAVTYQWQYRRSEAASWGTTSLEGYNTARLTVAATEGRDGYQYRCAITDGAGNKAYTDAATLRVARFTMEPESVTAAAGNTVEFAVATNMISGFTYKWQYTKDGTKWIDTYLAGFNTARLQVGVTVARNGYQYRCVLVDGAGYELATKAATLNAISISQQPVSVTVDEGATATFTVKMSVSGAYTYQWQYTKNGNDWYTTTMTGNKTATLKVGATTARNGYQYRCVISLDDQELAISNAATLTVNVPEPEVPVDPAKITYQPKNAKAFAGGKADFVVKATGAASFKWQFRRSESGTWQNTTMTGYNTNKLTVDVTAARDGYQYRCAVTGEDGNTVYSNAAELIVLEITKQPATGYGFVGSDTKFTVQVSDTAGIKYQWEYRKSATASWTNTTMTGYDTKTLTVAVTVARNGYQYRCKITDGFGNSVVTDGGTLTVVKITTQPKDQLSPLGGMAEFVVVTSHPQLVSYQWQYRISETGVWRNTTADGFDTDLLCVEVTSNRDGYQYRCVLTLSNGSETESNFATLNWY